jgi:hypothetical protein
MQALTQNSNFKWFFTLQKFFVDTGFFDLKSPPFRLLFYKNKNHFPTISKILFSLLLGYVFFY